MKENNKKGKGKLNDAEAQILDKQKFENHIERIKIFGSPSQISYFSCDQTFIAINISQIIFVLTTSFTKHLTVTVAQGF